jgi:SAM-dependent methyltransferase
LNPLHLLKRISAMQTPYENLDRKVSPNDGMICGNEAHYFSVGASAILNIKRALACAAGEGATPSRILDLPCGHGRVLRYLRAEFPQAEITACDLLEEGVDFCAATFGAIPVYSDPNPSRIGLPARSFDLIWVGSLFTHFDAPRWAIFLSFLRDLLRPGGVLVFSTHGRRSLEIVSEHPEIYSLDKSRRRQVLKQVGSTGFGYASYPGQRDYGISITMPAWVISLVTSVPELRLVGFSERSWDGHHDVCTCVRDLEWKASCTRMPPPLGRMDKIVARGDAA